MGKTYSIYQVADWFLSKEAMSPKKLQKLAYYAEAWNNALHNETLITDSIFEAWAHGPVSPELYQKYREHRWNDIPKIEDRFDIDAQSLDLLESVWLTYGEKSANELEALTHTEMPWRAARSRVGAQDGERCNEAISKDDMAAYYYSIYAGD